MEIELSVYLLTFLKLLTGFVSIVIHLKLANKSQTTQLTPIDFVGNFILGGIIGGVIYNPDISFLRYFITLLSAIVLISLLNTVSTKFMPARRMVMAKSVSIIENGRFSPDIIKGGDGNFDLIEFTASLRTQGIYSLQEVEFAQIEADGSLTVIKKGDGCPNYLLVKSGQVLHTQLERLGRDEVWLKRQLAALKLDLDDVFLAEFSGNRLLYAVDKNGTVFNRETDPQNA